MRIQAGYDPFSVLRNARAQQADSLRGMQSNFPYSQPTPPINNFGQGFGGPDTLTLSGQFPQQYGGENWGGQGAGPWGPDPNVFWNSGNGGRMSNGQSIEDLFNNPYGSQPDLSYIEEEMRRLQEARRMHGAQPPAKVGQKGDLRVIAGNRSDGVKPKEIRIDDANNYDYQKSENSYQDNRQEARFKDGTVGREYDVTVTWEDGSTTKKRVTLKQPNQIVYMDTAYSY